jgi:multimeric flavodoxin WrbA
MQTVKILGIVGSPRRNANTAQLVKKALEGAMSVPNVETELYEMAGKTFHPCIADYKCYRDGDCVYKDDLQDFVKKYIEADGIILGAPVYHMSVPATMKAALDRLGNIIMCNYLRQDKEAPRLNKVCGTLTLGAARNGGQEMTMNFLINSSLLNNGVVVSGDTALGNYIGAAASHYGLIPAEVDRYDRLMSKDVILEDKKGVELATNLGIRVAEMTRIVRAGISALEKELPSEYFYSWEDLHWD